MTERRDCHSPWLVIGAIALFVIHAANYLYFFVDDEAIPYVYAQNLLHGNGLSYNALEGRLEGYSDFLHVLWSTVILTVVHVMHFPKVSVFFVGKAVSVACGIGILLLVWMVLRRMHAGLTGATIALGALALAGPLALWSCSSLEAVPFAVIGTGLVAALLLESDRWAAATAALLILERIDGFIYGGTLIAAFIVTAAPNRRQEIWRRIVVPVSVVFVAYHGWRCYYFKDLIPSPIEAKILYKFLPHRNVIVKAPIETYSVRFVHAFGVPGILVLSAASAHALATDGWGRRLALGALPLTVYVAAVGDWMFGFRFFVILLPIFALILAHSMNRLAISRPRIAAAACLASLCYLGVFSVRFFQAYKVAEEMPSFIVSPSRDLHRFFWPYYGLYEKARQLVFPQDVTAYNQAGFIPFMLDVDNIDDLGICSRFAADVPSTDIYFTEVGRYAPLTNKRALRPVHAYVLYQHARFIMSPTDILYRANHDSVPTKLLGDRYELVATDDQGLNAIYRQIDNSPIAVDSKLFDENVAHVSYVRGVRVGDDEIDPKDFSARLPFLRDEVGAVKFTGPTELFVRFSDADVHVDEVSIQELRASASLRARVRMLTSDGRVAAETETTMAARRSEPLLLPVAAEASSLVIAIDPGDAQGELRITDLRVLGQRPALRKYIETHLRFPREY